MQGTSLTVSKVRELFKMMPYPWIVLSLTLCGQMGAAFSSQGFPVLYPFIQDELGLSRAQVGLITSALTGGSIATVLLGGWLADAVGVKRVMVTLLVATAVLMGAFLLTYTLLAILVVAVFIGFGQGPAYPATTRAVIDWVPSRILGLAISVKQAGVPLAGIIGAVLLPVVAVAAGWRIAALTLGGLILFIAITFLFAYRDPPQDNEAVHHISLSAILSLRYNRGFVIASLWAFGLVGIQFIVLSYFVLFLVKELQTSPVMAGGLFAMVQASSLFARVFWGAASDFVFQRRRIVVLALIGLLATGGLIGMSLVDRNVVKGALFFLAILIGATALSWNGVFTTLVGETASKGQAGITVGMSSTIMHIGMIVMPPLFGLLADISGSYIIGWRVAAAIAFVSTIILLAFGREPQRR